MLTLFLVTILVVFLLYYITIRPYDYWKKKGVHQGNQMCVFYLNWRTFLLKQGFVEMVQSVYNQFPGVRYSGTYQFFVPSLVVKDPDLLKQVTVKDFDHFVDHKTFMPEDVDPLWGTNLFSLKGNKWREMRAILSPSFTSSKMKTMFALVSECAENFIQHFLKKNEDVVTVEFKEVFTRFTTDVIASTAFGIQVDSLKNPTNPFYLMGKEATNFGSLRYGLRFLAYFLFPKICAFFKLKMFSKEVRMFFTKVVSDTIKMREDSNIVRPDMINLLLEAREGVQKYGEDGNDGIDTGFSTAQESKLVTSFQSKPSRVISNVDITAQAMIFFTAGFDTVSGLMSFLAYELAVNPDIQKRLREEVWSTLEECEGNITYEGLLKMKYMDIVVSEALRKWPIFMFIDRMCTKPYTIDPTRPDEKPVQLEKGDALWLPIYGIHHDPKHYADPDRFDPERFSEENKNNIKPYTYFPFGLGPRNCIGSRFALLEAKTVIFHILKNFELVPVERSVIPLQISKKQIVLNAEGGLWFGLKRI